MSYETWQTRLCGDAAVVGSTFWVNTKPVTVIGIAPRGILSATGCPVRRRSTISPIETMPAIANVPYVHDSDMQWLYMIGRVKPGVSLAALQAEGEHVCCGSDLARHQHFSGREGRQS